MFNKNRQQVRTKAATAHRESLIRSLNYRLEAARAKGDQQLINQLEAEANYLHIK